jgi:predicted amidohydrolase
MKIVCCQLDIVWEDKAANCQRAASLLRAAELPANTLVVLPELFASGFSMNVAATGENAGGPTEQFLAGLAQELGVFLVGGIAVLDREARARNQAVTFSPTGQLLARYSKIHPFSLGQEDQHYTAGSEVVVWKWQGCAVAPFICYDLRFPEVFRSAVRRGAEVLIVIANWPSKRETHWVTLLRARAIENQAYVVGVNRCGADPNHIYPGKSMVIDPLGEVLAERGNEECLISADIDLPALQAWRENFPALADMRTGPWQAEWLGGGLA